MAELRKLLLWARKEGIAIESATVGTVGITLSQHLQPGTVRPGKAGSPSRTLYEEMGGKQLEDLIDVRNGDNDWKPAIE